ncbi:hypothetical protein ACFX13_035922 [Malus domestica]
MCLKHTIAQTNAQNTTSGVVGAAKSHLVKVNKAITYLREETKPRNALTSLSRPQASIIRAKHLKSWMRICDIAMVQKTIGPVFAELPRRL